MNVMNEVKGLRRNFGTNSKPSNYFLFISTIKLFKWLVIVVFLKYQLCNQITSAEAKSRGLIYNKDGKFIYRPPKSNQGHIIVIDDRYRDSRPQPLPLVAADSSYARISGLDSTYQPIQILNPRVVGPDGSSTVPLRGLLASGTGGQYQLINLADLQPLLGRALNPTASSASYASTSTSTNQRAPVAATTFHISTPPATNQVSMQAYQTPSAAQASAVQVLPILQLYQAPSSAALPIGSKLGPSVPQTTSPNGRSLRYDHSAANLSPSDYMMEPHLQSPNQIPQHEFMELDQLHHQAQTIPSSLYARPRINDADTIAEGYDQSQHPPVQSASHLEAIHLSNHHNTVSDDLLPPLVASKLSAKQKLQYQQEQQRRLFNALQDYDHEDLSYNNQHRLQHDRDSYAESGQVTPRFLNQQHHQHQPHHNQPLQDILASSLRPQNPLFTENVSSAARSADTARNLIKLPVSETFNNNNNNKSLKKMKRNSGNRINPGRNFIGVNTTENDSRRIMTSAAESQLQDELNTDPVLNSKDIKSPKYWKQFKDQYDFVQ